MSESQLIAQDVCKLAIIVNSPCSRGGEEDRPTTTHENPKVEDRMEAY